MTDNFYKNEESNQIIPLPYSTPIIGTRSALISFAHEGKVSHLDITNGTLEYSGDLPADESAKRLFDFLLQNIGDTLLERGIKTEVVQLEWKLPSFSKDTWYAESVLGTYTAWASHFRPPNKDDDGKNSTRIAAGPTSVDSRAAAQAHFEAEIRSAISVKPLRSKPDDHVWVKCPNGHGSVEHQHYDHCGFCSQCGAVMQTVKV